ncbi:MAG: VWA domain-containing protein [Nitrospiraceae bacterium]|nr:VWA domain-containing protein [Nitrospiraceae bacterium]
MKRGMVWMVTGALLAAGALLAPAPSDASQATEGCLRVIDDEGQPKGFCPLEHTSVDVDISGFIARVTLTQRFSNPYEEPIEAVYTFPMSDRAAVDSMTMTIGDRVIKGLIKEREEARRIYERARDAGQAASLLDQERPNIFTQSVANILPGDAIEITISYVEYLKYEDGEYEFSFPMVVGPRYIPGGGSTQGPMQRGSATPQVPDGGRITPPITPKGKRAGHDIDIAVHLDAGVPIRGISSELHAIEKEHADGSSEATVRLKRRKTIPNRDFVLRYAVAGEEIGDAVLTHTGAQGGFFTLILQPPERVRPEAITPKEMIFVIDSSGSMRGFPINKAKKTMRLCIEQMNPRDTFNLVSFAGGTGYCFQNPVPNTVENRRKALDYLDNLEGSGGTEMMKAIHAALGRQNDPKRLRVVCFMTDGYIGNDMAILDAIQKNRQTARVFSFGIGNSVNRFLLEGMAREGRGACEIVTLETESDEAAERFHERIHSPILTDITVDFGHLAMGDIYPDPGALPDLFAARPLVLKGRYTEPGQGTITIRGRTAAGPFERAIDVALPDEDPGHDVLAPLWARARIGWLMARDWAGAQRGDQAPNLKDAITQLGLDFGLMTQYTSFVAVEQRVITEGGRPKTIDVPVEMPDGVSYDGIFGENAREQLSALGYLSGAPAAKMTSRARGGAQPVLGLQFKGTPRNAPASVSAPLPELSPTPQRTVALDMAEPASDGARVSAETVGELESKEESDTLKDTLTQQKLDPSLWNLAGKLTNGNYSNGPVKVRNGWIEVVIRLTDDSDKALKALEAAGVKVISHAGSGKKVLARVRVAGLARIAALSTVARIEPPGV